jgi:succinate-acetate transporter protein
MSYENEGISVKDTNNTTSSSSNDEGHFGPLAQVNTASSRYPAFGGDLQPGLYRLPKDRKIANPAPLGLCAFALTTFVLGCINMEVRGITAPNMVVAPSLAYGGLVQLCAGMWYVDIGKYLNCLSI